MLAYRGTEQVDLEGEGVFDELVVGEWLHLEQMDHDLWWLRVGDARILVTVAAGEEPIVDVQRGFYAAQRGTSEVCD